MNDDDWDTRSSVDDFGNEIIDWRLATQHMRSLGAYGFCRRAGDVLWECLQEWQ